MKPACPRPAGRSSSGTRRRTHPAVLLGPVPPSGMAATRRRSPATGSYESPVPATTSERQWTFTFAATSAAGKSVSQSRTLTEQAPPPTPTASLTLNEASLPPTGGTIVLRYSSKNASSCSLGLDLRFWTGATRRRSPATEATSRRFPRPRQRGSGRSPSPLPAPLASQCPSPGP